MRRLYLPKPSTQVYTNLLASLINGTLIHDVFYLITFRMIMNYQVDLSQYEANCDRFHLNFILISYLRPMNFLLYYLCIHHWESIFCGNFCKSDDLFESTQLHLKCMVIAYEVLYILVCLILRVRLFRSK